jgi:glycosyltransferase involved in cell wall biosynthesis
MKLSVVIPTYNRCAILEKTLTGLCNQAEPEHLHEVIIVSDGSTDNTSAVVEGFRARLPIKFLPLTKSTVSITRNTGLDRAKSPVVVFLDDDIVPSRQFLAEHAKFHQEFPAPEAALLGYVTWSPENRISPFMRWYGEYGGLAAYSLIRGKGPISSRFLVTANVSVKKEFAQRIGGFNPKLTVHEDYDFGYRLAAMGLKMYFRREAVGYHYQSFTFEQACLRCKRLSANVAPLLATHAGRELLRRESRRSRRIIHGLARIPAAMFSPLLRFIDSDIVLPNTVYRLLYWDRANRPYRLNYLRQGAATFTAKDSNSFAVKESRRGSQFSRGVVQRNNVSN